MGLFFSGGGRQAVVGGENRIWHSQVLEYCLAGGGGVLSVACLL